MSRTFKWALALLVAACISVPAVAFAAPGLSDLSQTDAASEAANLPDEGDGEDARGDTAAMPPASNPAQEDGAPGTDGAPEDNGTSTADGLASPQNDLDADTDDEASVLAETEGEPGENVEAEAAVSSADEDPDTALRGPANRAAIYINGSSGNDANPGTEAAPVKTFAKAKELLEASGGGALVGVYGDILTIGEGAILQNNSVESRGSWYPEGGGIYVNGYSSAYSDYHNGELYLTNVEVSGNNAAIEGGGYAACPVSVTEINLTNGAAPASDGPAFGRRPACNRTDPRKGADSGKEERGEQATAPRMIRTELMRRSQ